jgi:hypothetical protein
MKSVKVVGLIATVLLSIVSGRSKAQRTSGDQQHALAGKKVLIVYVSKIINTRGQVHTSMSALGG